MLKSPFLPFMKSLRAQGHVAMRKTRLPNVGLHFFARGHDTFAEKSIGKIDPEARNRTVDRSLCGYIATKCGGSTIPILVWYCSKKHRIRVNFRPSLLLWPRRIHSRTRKFLPVRMGENWVSRDRRVSRSAGHESRWLKLYGC